MSCRFSCKIFCAKFESFFFHRKKFNSTFLMQQAKAAKISIWLGNDEKIKTCFKKFSTTKMWPTKLLFRGVMKTLGMELLKVIVLAKNHPVWPVLAKFRHFGEILKDFCFFKVDSKGSSIVVNFRNLPYADVPIW